MKDEYCNQKSAAMSSGTMETEEANIKSRIHNQIQVQEFLMLETMGITPATMKKMSGIRGWNPTIAPSGQENESA